MKITLSIIFTLICLSSYCQTKILSGLDFNSEYEFYISGSPNVVLADGEEKKSNDFIYTNQEVIRNIIKTWKGKKTNAYLKCGYNYGVYIIKENKIVEFIRINDQCNQLVYSKGAVDIKDNPFSKLDSDIKFSTYCFKTTSKDEALKSIDSIKNLENVYCENCNEYDFNDSEEDLLDEYTLCVFGKSQNILLLSNSR